MSFVVGGTLIGIGALMVWGGISGRMAKMLAALFPSQGGAKTASFSPPDTGFQQLNLNGVGQGVTLS